MLKEDEYINLNKLLKKLESMMNNDVAIIEIENEIQRLVEKRDVIISRYEQLQIPIMNRLSDIKQGFLMMYKDKKTVPLNRLTLKFSETRSFKVIYPRMIVDTLIKINKVEKGVKTFSTKYLRSLADAELLPSGSYEWDIKLNLSIKEKEEV